MRRFINIIETHVAQDPHYVRSKPLLRWGAYTIGEYELKNGLNLSVSVVDVGATKSVTASIAKEDGTTEIVGEGTAVLEDGSAYFSNIAVSPKYQRMGIATAMYDQIEEMFDVEVTPSPGEIEPSAMSMWEYRYRRPSRR